LPNIFIDIFKNGRTICFIFNWREEIFLNAIYQGIFKRDIALLGVFTVAMWLVVGYVFFQVIDVAPGIGAKIIVGGSGGILIAFATSAMFAVFLHLRKNGPALYEEEATNRD
jgi:hypothetical protein